MRIFTLGGHLGEAVSALVDGQLDPRDEERAWSHVMTCPGCRRAVEHEGQVKSRLATLRGETCPPQLHGALYDARAWATADAIAPPASRRRSLVALGAGSVGAAFLGLTALAGVPVSTTNTPPPAPVTSIKGSVGGGPASGPTTPAPLLRARTR
ncbi:zf-HC2 domain-containing protein [Nocardioides massiliensis]|uniref:Anti-sigma factor RsiW n=1 Tax=Nocardioides massiliensis TaxID=1325935 RepID=A0ABT9NUP4_9ACTN|nr:zf-HC2 domain-containing protein [Nocardioides massiliensis]MDP9824153.1 anti-sigma factor RsiW [Nocardioides massiliensis]